MKKKYKFRFFFDYGSGGCLWAGNVETASKFENPADATIYDLKGNILYNPSNFLTLSKETFLLIEELNFFYKEIIKEEFTQESSSSIKKQSIEFNNKVKVLFNKIKKELGNDFEIINEQKEVIL